jgi:diaminopimelate epimerase
MKFYKLQATGNDFILVDGKEIEYDWGTLAQSMCRQHSGVGADGLIVLQQSKIADLKMRVFNPDGSEAEACGNGLRCFVKYAIESDIVGKMPLHPKAQGKAKRRRINPCLDIETLSGIRQAKAWTSGGRVSRVEVNMGVPQFEPEQIPIRERIDIMPILNYPLMIGERKLALSLLSMGNPHAVCLIPEPVIKFPLHEVGPEVEKHSMFPRGVNFEVARVLNKKRIEARVWERGVGETLACGSGACAIVVVGRLLNCINDNIDIMFPGGVLTVSWDGEGEVMLAGSVDEVFHGEWLE